MGKIVPGTEIRIVDPATGNEVAAGHAGEVSRQEDDGLLEEEMSCCANLTAKQIWARGPQVSMGYLNNPAATAETYGKDGYLRTGDLGAIDVDGFITIHDRIKEMIKVIRTIQRTSPKKPQGIAKVLIRPLFSRFVVTASHLPSSRICFTATPMSVMWQ